jgi:hypothetical protein
MNETIIRKKCESYYLELSMTDPSMEAPSSLALSRNRVATCMSDPNHCVNNTTPSSVF